MSGITGSEPVSRHFDSIGLKLHYADWGNDGAPLLVLLHGGRDHARMWDRVAAALRDDYHVIAPDLRGHGDSAHSPDLAYALTYLIADFANLVEHLGAEKLYVAAHSLGAATTLRYTGLYPDRIARLAAIEGTGFRTPGQRGPLHDRIRKFIETARTTPRRDTRHYPTFEAACDRMRASNPHLDDALVRHLTLHGSTRYPDGSYGWKFDRGLSAWFPSELTEDDIRGLWREITCPVWLVHGAESFARHPDEDGVSAEFRDVQVTSYKGAGHWLQHDRADAFIEDLRTFLSGGKVERER